LNQGKGWDVWVTSNIDSVNNVVGMLIVRLRSIDICQPNPNITGLLPHYFGNFFLHLYKFLSAHPHFLKDYFNSFKKLLSDCSFQNISGTCFMNSGFKNLEIKKCIPKKNFGMIFCLPDFLL